MFCLSFGLLLSSQVASSPASQEEEGVIPSVYSEELGSAAEDNNEGRVYFVLEESSGYMEPSLRFLAVAHTLIAFCCIIGYYCLKVYWLGHVLLQISKELISLFQISFSPSYKPGVSFKTTEELTIKHIADNYGF